MQAGLVIYATNLDTLTQFYTEVFGLPQTEGDNSYCVLTDGVFELVLLETEISKQLSKTEARTATAIKPAFFTDTPLEEISRRVVAHGGKMFAPKSWEFGGRLVCDGCDSEGNIFQCRITNHASASASVPRP